jgi:hypothetical protein
MIKPLAGEGYLATSLAFEEWFVSSVPIWKLK